MGQDFQEAVSAAQDVCEYGHDRPTWGLTRRSAVSSVEPLGSATKSSSCRHQPRRRF